MTVEAITITRKPKETWVPVWWNCRLYGGQIQRFRAIAGNPSKSGKTVRIRVLVEGGQIERSVKPKNLEPR